MNMHKHSQYFRDINAIFVFPPFIELIDFGYHRDSVHFEFRGVPYVNLHRRVGHLRAENVVCFQWNGAFKIGQNWNDDEVGEPMRAYWLCLYFGHHGESVAKTMTRIEDISTHHERMEWRIAFLEKLREVGINTSAYEHEHTL